MRTTMQALAALLGAIVPAMSAQPATAAPVPALSVTEVNPGVFVHLGALQDWAPSNGGDVANLGFVVGSRCVAVIDTGGTPRVGQALRAAVAKVTTLPVCYVINTHAHPDHMLGNSAFAGASPDAPRFVASAAFTHTLAAREPYYLHALERDFGLRLTHESVVYPGVAVAGTLDIDLGERVLTLRAWPTAHTDNDLTVYDRRTRTLFASDLLFVQHLPALDGSLRGWISALGELKTTDAATVVPGHGPVSRDWPRAMQPQEAYLGALLRDTRAALRDALTIGQAIERVAVAPGPQWLLVDRFHRRNVSAAYAELEWEDEPRARADDSSASAPEASAIWQRVRASLFQSRPIETATDDVISLSVPARAEDAAIVPIAIKTGMPQTPQRYIDKVVLVIDNNPSPISAIFHFTQQSGRADIETRVRIDEYTHVRAIAETNDGRLHMATRFVKASGGCSAPPAKDAQAAAATLGRMRLRVEGERAPNRPLLAQLMISHPNDSGLAMDQVSRLYTAPHFVRQVTITYGGEPVMSADVDFSISENPHLRFYFVPRGDGELRAEVVDSKGLHFESALKIPTAGTRATR